MVLIPKKQSEADKGANTVYDFIYTFDRREKNERIVFSRNKALIISQSKTQSKIPSTC